MHVLLIEDNEDDAELIREALFGTFFPQLHLHWAGTLEAGFVALAQNQVDAIFSGSIASRRPRDWKALIVCEQKRMRLSSLS